MDDNEVRLLRELRQLYVDRAPLKRSGHFVACWREIFFVWHIGFGSETKEGVQRLVVGWAERHPRWVREWVIVGPREDGDG